MVSSFHYFLYVVRSGQYDFSNRHDDVNSKVIKSLDISEYSRSIYDLITNEKLRCKLSENAFNCLHYFTVKNVMLRWVDLYNSLLK